MASAVVRCFHKEAAGIAMHMRDQQQHLGNRIRKNLYQGDPRSRRGSHQP